MPGSLRVRLLGLFLMLALSEGMDLWAEHLERKEADRIELEAWMADMADDERPARPCGCGNPGPCTCGDDLESRAQWDNDFPLTDQGAELAIFDQAAARLGRPCAGCLKAAAAGQPRPCQCQDAQQVPQE